MALLLLCVLFVLAYQPPQPLTLDLAAPSNEKFLDGFYAPDRDARWTNARSALWLSGLGGSNLAWRIGLRLSGPRPRGVAPPRVVVYGNGQRLAEFVAANEERDYECNIAPWQLGISGDLLLEITSEAFKSSSSPDEFGVRVTRVWLTRGDGFALPSLKTFALLLGLIGSSALLVKRCAGALLRSTQRRINEIAFTRSLGFPLHPLAVILAVLWLLIVVALTLNRAETTWWLGLLLICALFIVALTWLIARIIIVTSLTQRQTFGLVAVFTLAALARLGLDFGRGYEIDVGIYLSLAWKTVHYGIHSAYLDVNGVPPSDNPPLLLYPFWLLGWLYQQFISPAFPQTGLSDAGLLRLMLRLPSLIADLLAGALIFRALRRVPLTFQMSLIAASAYLFNPALIFDSAYWGQTAAIHTLFMLLSVIAVDRRAFGWAGAALAAAVLTKPQALAIAPLVFLLAWRERGLGRFSAAASITALLINMPFLVTGTIGKVVTQYVRTTEYHPVIAANAHNFWWFVTGGRGWQPDTLALGSLTFRSAGLLLFAGATLLSVILVWRERRMLFLAAAYQSLAFFMLNTQIHENHLLPMFAPFVIVAALDGNAWWNYGAFTFTTLTNMVLHDPNLLTSFGYASTEVFGGPALALPRWLNAAAQTFLFIAFTWRLIKPFLRESRPPLAQIEAN